jgi:hypothetical protein
MPIIAPPIDKNIWEKKMIVIFELVPFIILDSLYLGFSKFF